MIKSVRLKPLCAGSVACASLLFSANTEARHTSEEHITTDTAWTLEGEKNWHIGLFKAQFTIADRLSVGTYIWPWIVGVPSLQLKWRFFSSGPLHFAFEGGVFRVDTSHLDRRGSQPNPPILTVTTGTLSNSFEFSSRHQLSSNLVLTGLRVEGELTNDTLRGAGEGAFTNLQYVGAYEYRMSQTIAIVLTARYQLLSVAAGKVSSTTEPDEFTTIELAAQANDDTVINFKHAFSIVPSFNASWDTFNMRLGVGYGNYNLPGVNFMLPERTIVPEIDLFWTF